MIGVAARAGVSQATVSLILNGSPGARFSDATRRKVREAAEALGYRLPGRDQVDQAEVKSIVFIADEISTDPWMALAFEGAREKALEHGVMVTLAMTRGGRTHDGDVFKLFQDQRVIGFIYGTILTRQVAPPPPLLAANAVLLNCYDPKRRLPSVLPGDLEGGRAATEYLVKAGRRRIGFINGQDGLDGSSDRLRGYRQALASNDISFDPDLVFPGNWEPSSGYEGGKALLRLASPPDAIFCANDLMALGCYDALKEAGLDIPRDVSVIGFDNRDIAQFVKPALTTLILPQFEMGSVAAELVLELAGGLKPRHDQLKVECTIVERASVALAEDAEAISRAV